MEEERGEGGTRIQVVRALNPFKKRCRRRAEATIRAIAPRGHGEGRWGARAGGVDDAIDHIQVVVLLFDGGVQLKGAMPWDK